MEGLKEYLQNLPPRGLKVSLRTKVDYMEFLKGKYGINIDISEMAYMFMNDMNMQPLAPCGDICKFENVSIGYAEFCSKPKFGENKCIPCSNHVQEMKKKRSLELHGVENPAQRKDVREKMDKTNLERYGTTRPQQLDFVKEKSIKTNLEKYGVEHPSMLEQNQQKRQDTVQVKYGVPNTLLTGKASLESRYNSYKEKYIKIGFELLSPISKFDEIGAHGILDWKCLECNREISKVDQCLRCPTCNPYSSSTEEIELREYIENILPNGVNIRYNVRDIIENREIDIYIPEHNICIEYSGDYWHSDIHKDFDYHQDKCLKVMNNGMKLITIYGSTWLTKRDIVKQRLKHAFGITNIKIPARKTKCVHISNEISSEFLEKYHIQGKCQSSIRYGLYYDSELVAVMTFGVPRFNDKYQYELIRFATKYSVQGAASKLLSAFEREHTPKSLLSYADLNWGVGNLYKSIGFEQTGITSPSYFYYDRRNEVVYSRFQMQKKRLIERYGFDEKQTAEEMIKTLNFFKVFDCGSLVFVKKYQ